MIRMLQETHVALFPQRHFSTAILRCKTHCFVRISAGLRKVHVNTAAVAELPRGCFGMTVDMVLFPNLWFYSSGSQNKQLNY